MATYFFRCRDKSTNPLGKVVVKTISAETYNKARKIFKDDYSDGLVIDSILNVDGTMLDNSGKPLS